MKNILLIITLILFCSSCFVHKGRWINNEQCRPKKSNFKLLNTSFKTTNLLVFNKVYTLNGDKKEAYGFYSDGRFIQIFNYNIDIQNYTILNPDLIKLKNWKNARFIGYWRVKNNIIKIEYFVCGNSGVYIRKQGEINGDTIIFEKDCGNSNPFKTIKCSEKYILSDMSFE